MTLSDSEYRHGRIPYDPYLKELARELRKNSTKSEKAIWYKIRRKQLGPEFHRQVPMLNYIVDFYCHELNLVIELDGVSHDTPDAWKADENRQNELERESLQFLRFRDEEVFENLDNVGARIIGYIEFGE